MAPDDLKFVRMETRLQEQQQQIMAELDLGQLTQASVKSADSSEAIARAGLGETIERPEDKMNFLLDANRFEAAPKLLINGNECQKYGACESTTTTATTTTKSSDNLEEVGGELCRKGRVRPLDATIGGNKFAARLEEKFCHEDEDLEAKLAREGEISSDGGNQMKNNEPDDEMEFESKSCIIQRLAKVIPCFGIILALCASCFLGTAGMLVKLVESVHGIEVAVFRAMIQMTIYAGIICCRQQRRWLPPRKELLPVASRALFGGTSITFSYYALKLIPLGDATTIRFSLPIWTLIMGFFFLQEPCSFYKILAVVISISGVVLVTKPDDCIHLLNWLLSALFNYRTSTPPPSLWPIGSNQTLMPNNGSELLADAYERQSLQDIEEIAMLVDSPPPLTQGLVGATSLEGPAFSQMPANVTDQQQQQDIDVEVAKLPLVGTRPVPSDPLRQLEGCSMALASSVCLALSIVALRMCKQTPSEVTIFWLSSSSVVIGTLTLIMLAEWSLPDNLHDCLFILLNGVCGALGQWFMTNALKVEQSGLVSLARTFDIEVAFLYSALLLGEQIRSTSIVGSVLVSLGVIIVLLPRLFNCSPSDSRNNQDDDDEHRSQASNNSTQPQTDTTSETDSVTGRLETLTTILNGYSLDGRQSSTDARSIECLKSEHGDRSKSSPAAAAADKPLVCC